MRKGVATVLIVIAVMSPQRSRAQVVDSAEFGSVAGTVYDSVTARLIAGALVQILPATDLTAQVRSATSNARGVFVIDSLAAGRYLMAFAHAALDTLALASQRVVVEVRAGSRTTVALTVPSVPTIRAAFCGAAFRQSADSSGVLLGRIRNARTRLILLDGFVETRWQELILGRGSLTVEPRTARSVLFSEGWYVLCGIPGGTEIAAMAASVGDSSGLVEVLVPSGGILRRDFLVGGSASVRGLVIGENGIPIPSARVGIAGSESGVDTDSSGAFIAPAFPAGSQTLDVRALGYVPARRRLDLMHGADTMIVVKLTSVKQVLDTIRVVGQRVYDRDRSGFLRRQRAGHGFFMDERTIDRIKPIDAYQLLARAPGARVTTQGFRKLLLFRDRGGGSCIPTIVLDGMRLPSDFAGELESLVHARHLAAIEVYRGIQAPAEFADLRGCGTVVLWTKPPASKPRPDDR